MTAAALAVIVFGERAILQIGSGGFLMGIGLTAPIRLERNNSQGSLR